MFNNQILAGRQIVKQIVPSEDAIDGSIVQNAKLIISLVEARKKMGVPAAVGHDAILSATAGIAALTEARDHTIACHRQLASLRDELGFSPQAMGCTTGLCETGNSEAGPNGHLKVVQSEVA
ncbi:MAG TPA: hypothetical protein VGR19_00100 [Allosphingosinicella sp.]|nr:hypothetical protein [Allosphingosinicella sp.]